MEMFNFSNNFSTLNYILLSIKNESIAKAISN